MIKRFKNSKENKSEIFYFSNILIKLDSAFSFEENDMGIDRSFKSAAENYTESNPYFGPLDYEPLIIMPFTDRKWCKY